jgi:hypothetical protein
MELIYLIIIIILLIILLFIIWNKQENFTNQSGVYLANANQCSSLTMSNCLNSSSCVWCMKSEKGFDSQCIPGNPNDQSVKQQCDRVYANDVWTRSVLSNDSDYKKYMDLPIMDK